MGTAELEDKNAFKTCVENLCFSIKSRCIVPLTAAALNTSTQVPLCSFVKPSRFQAQGPMPVTFIQNKYQTPLAVRDTVIVIVPALAGSKVRRVKAFSV